MNILFILIFVNVCGPISKGLYLISHSMMELTKNAIVQIPLKLILKMLSVVFCAVGFRLHMSTMLSNLRSWFREHT